MKVQAQRYRMILSRKGIFALVIIILVVIGCGGRNRIDNEQAKEEDLTPDSVYSRRGNQLVALTFDTLRNSLLREISSHGIDSAIRFCKVNANALTSTYADSVTIRRTALRYRNPRNRPDSLERLVLDEMSTKIKSGGVSEVIRRSSGEVHFFKPILLQPMCLNCHGAPGKQIQPATLARIRDLYPDDRAIDFSQGDLRGVWHVIFTPQKK